ncbi:MAG: RidA family protein [Pyrinomonadaceae bacterium]
MSLLLPILVLSVGALVFAQKTRPSESTQQAPVRFINPPTMPKPSGYTHVVDVARGRIIYIAGQVALDRSGNVVGRGDFRAQTQQVFENLKAALEASGASFRNVIKLNNYVVDMSQVQAFRETRDKYVNTENPPASTTVGVQRLVREEFLVEVEAIAVVPN